MTGRPQSIDDEAVLFAARAILARGAYPSAEAVCTALGRRWGSRTCLSSLQRLRWSGRLVEPPGVNRETGLNREDKDHDAEIQARAAALKLARCQAGRLLTRREIDSVLSEVGR